MLEGVNVSLETVRKLAELMRGFLYDVNSIPYNTTPDALFAGTSDAKIWEFAEDLDAAGVPLTVRRNIAREIAATCGQLRARAQAPA
jgi:23S rRNA (adenine2503-C2)-methyltransferase